MKRTARILAGIILALAVAMGGLVAYHWAPDRPVSALAARWAPPPSQFVPIGGLQVHLRDEGPRDDPTPIVLLHGTSASLHTWDGWVAALLPRHRVVRLDLPGFGLTGPEPDDDYSMGRYVEFVTAALDTLGIEQCVIAGNSFGGWISWETALGHPDRIKGLVLVDAAGYPLHSESVPIGFRLANVPVLNRVMQSVLPRGVVESSLRNTYGDPSRVTPELVDRYYEITLREGNRRALTKRFAAGRGTTEPERIRSLRGLLPAARGRARGTSRVRCPRCRDGSARHRTAGSAGQDPPRGSASATAATGCAPAPWCRARRRSASSGPAGFLRAG